MLTLITLLVYVLVVCVLVWGTRELLRAFAVVEPFRTVIYVLVVFICALWFLGQFVGLGPLKL